MEQPFVVTIPWNDDLNAALTALAIPHTRGEDTIQIEMNTDIDGRLEALIGCLSELRWFYTPGRTIQLELPNLGVGDHAH